MAHSSESGSGFEVRLDCDVYVDALSPDTVVGVLSRALGVRVSSVAMRFGSVDLTAAHNDYETTGGDPDDFVQWGTVLECEAISGVTLAQVVQDVGVVLESLRGAGYRAVAACDYEEELPGHGHG